MNETSEMCTPSILSGTPNAISLPELAAGATPSASPAGLTMDPAGLAPVRASLSARQAKEQGLMTSGTYGPRSSTSPNSANLRLSLESKLPARLDSRGSTLFKLTWKRRVTPQGQSIYALRASGRRTSVSVYSGVPTPCGQDGPNGGPGQGTDRLPGAAALAAVPSPCTPNGGRSMSIEKMDATGKTLDGRKHTASLEHVAKFSSVPTPTGAPDSPASHNKQSGQGLSDLVAKLASVPTPNTPSGEPNPRSTPTHTGGMDLEGAASLAVLAHCISPQASDANGAGANQNTANLDLQVRLAAAATPAARDYKSNSSTEEFQLQQWNHPRGSLCPRRLHSRILGRMRLVARP